MLEHLASGERDQALAGDLEEEFRSGRTEGWYWRQVLIACLISWRRSLERRLPVLVFALLWSLPAPVWFTLLERWGNAPFFDRLWAVLGGLWIFAALALWIAAHALFLWVGIVVFALGQAAFSQPVAAHRLRRSLWLAPLVFTPLHGLLFLLVDLYWYSIPGLAAQHLSVSLLAQTGDLRVMASLIRLPYSIALAAALWMAIPRTRRQESLFADEDNSRANEDNLEPMSDAYVSRPRRYFLYVAAAGLINALLVAALLCQLPEPASPSLLLLLSRALATVALAALAGAGGAWLYWRSPASPFRTQAPILFERFAHSFAPVWLALAPMTVLSEEGSPAAALAAFVAAYALAAALVRSPMLAPAHPSAPAPEYTVEALFQESLSRPPIEFYGYLLALGLYAAAAALALNAVYTAALLLALCGFLLAWKRHAAPSEPETGTNEGYRVRSMRLAGMFLLAVAVTVWALWGNAAPRPGMSRAALPRNAAPKANAPAAGTVTALGANGYESLLLWPVPERKQIVAPVAADELLAPGATAPAELRFTGVYQYTQPPEQAPGAEAHRASGSPLAVEIASSNARPVEMEARQLLRRPVALLRCGAVEVLLLNRDNRPGQIGVSLELSDGSAHRLTLPRQMLASAAPERFTQKSAPVFERLRFPLPARASLRRFDQIEVRILAGPEHTYVAPRLAVESFRLLPRR
jgi:hypothetical protein